MAYFTTSDGIKLAYLDEGSGEGIPLLLLAGLTRDARDFNYLMPYLEGHRVIRLDYRGRGNSEWADPATYSIPVEARDVVELLDHLELPRVGVIGTSRGGLIGMALAGFAKPRLVGVLLNDVGPVIELEGLKTIAGYIGRAPSVATREELAAILPKVRNGFANVSAHRWLEEATHHTELTDTGLGITYDPKLAVVMEGLDTPSDLDPWLFFDTLAELPIALLRGTGSDLLSAETAREMQARRPDMIYGEVADRGHVPFLDEPECLDVIQRWIACLT